MLQAPSKLQHEAARMTTPTAAQQHSLTTRIAGLALTTAVILGASATDALAMISINHNETVLRID
jgi:hypothetical protein